MRLRRRGIAEMIRETRLENDDLIYPIIVDDTIKNPTEIVSLPGLFRHTTETAVSEAANASELGVPAIILFGVPSYKDETGSSALTGIVQDSIREIKRQIPRLVVIADVCLCEYTSHGHCGLVDQEGYLAVDPTLSVLQKIALSYAEAGVDMVAPSGMIDNMVGAIRTSLDENGFTHVPIMSYSAKYNSKFYGPFREAVQSTYQFGDRSTHQMDPANSDEAMREVALDIEEGADIVMVKPALPYLDIIYRIKTSFEVPVAAYNVSGEYAMLKSAINLQYLDDTVIYEALLSIKRAGADMIITYFAKDIATMLPHI
ncbi:MAG TPA: porphobilinogen synthase [Candidatus Acidoferrum sp.]|nr:porphobilinogen synthase [Candidatus Acidoferrum sp.]